jgi:hypothetical protein
MYTILAVNIYDNFGNYKNVNNDVDLSIICHGLTEMLFDGLERKPIIGFGLKSRLKLTYALTLLHRQIRHQRIVKFAFQFKRNLQNFY